MILEDYRMKKLALCVCLPLPLALSACGTDQLPIEDLRGMKPACAAGDMAVCADIGHTIRRDNAESYYKYVNPT